MTKLDDDPSSLRILGYEANTRDLTGRFVAFALFASTVMLVAALSACPIAASADSTELRIGQQILQQYEAQGLVLHGTRYNAIVEPIARRIGAAGAGLYDEPFRFFVLHNKQPNAFSVPGGFMFINDSLIDFVKTQDELACVSGHELAHVIHHDVMNRLKREQQTGIWLALGQLLLGGRAASIASTALQIQHLHFDRKVETAADQTGSDICAKADFNPYGLIWMMEQFERLPNQTRTMEMFSDHPRDDHRMSDLENHFKAYPAVFGRFNAAISSGTPIRRR